MALVPTRKIPQLTAYGAMLQGTEQLEVWAVNTSRRITSRDFVLPIDSVVTLTPLGVVGNNGRQLISSPTVQVTDNGPGTTVQLDALGAGALPGNPTSQIGLTAINGVAVTWMRSDAAPALSQAIIPVWTGLHTFTAGALAAANDPFLRLSESDAAINNRVWDFTAVGEQFRGRVGDDALAAFANWLEIDRTLNAIDVLNLLGTSVQVNGSPIITHATGFVNPTGTVGLIAINGVATTAMRSDAAPPLSQAIVPTWTGIHTFSATPVFNAGITTTTVDASGLVTAGSILSDSTVLISSVQPQMDWDESDAAANNRRWRIQAQSEQLQFQTVNDANNASVTWLAVDRTLNVVDTIALTSTALTWNGSPISTAVGADPTASVGLATVDGVATTYMRSDGAPALSQAIAPTWTASHTFTSPGTTAAPIILSSAFPNLVWNETDAAADNRRWDFLVNGEQFVGRVVNDAISVAANWITVDRTGTTVSLVAFPTGTNGSFLAGLSGSLGAGVGVAQISGGATTAALCAHNTIADFQTLRCWNSDTVGTNFFVTFNTEASITERGSITFNRGGGLTAYNTTSDVRRKKNIRNSESASDLIDQIQVRAFDWIDSDAHLEHWLVAQELYEIFPAAVSVGNDLRDWAVDPSKLVPLMVKEIQDLRKRLAKVEKKPDPLY